MRQWHAGQVKVDLQGERPGHTIIAPSGRGRPRARVPPAHAHRPILGHVHVAYPRVRARMCGGITHLRTPPPVHSPLERDGECGRRSGEQQVTIIVSRTLKDKRQGEVQMEWTEGGRRRRGVRNETYRRGEPTTHPHSGTQDRQSSFQRFERCQHLPIPLSPNQHSLSMM